jgi:hypothetical protein
MPDGIIDKADAAREDDRRQSAIDNITGLYPPDSEYEDTRRLGLEDMLCALAAEWRTLPVEVLEHMAQAQHFRDHRL